MKNINHYFSDVRPMGEYIKESLDINEGLGDILNSIKAKIGQACSAVIDYFGSFVARIKDWFMVTDEEGKILPCSTPMTAGNAWVSGYINKQSTFVGMGKKSGKICKTNEPFSNAKKMYPSTKQWWKELRASSKFESKQSTEDFIKMISESNSEEINQILNEVKLHTEDPQAKYNIIVDNNRLRKVIKQHVTNGRLARIMIWGAPGIGKTAILNTIVDEISSEQGKDYHLIVKTLSNETPDNFMLPKYTDDGRADDVPKTWLPVWRPTGDKKVDAELDAKCGRGMLFIDELSRATAQVQNVVLPLINEGVINGWRLGSGWSIVCASNRDEDESAGGQTQIGNALSNRFAQVYYEPCVDTWRQWADKQGFMSPLLLQWLAMPETESLAGGKFFYYDPNEEGTSENTTHMMCTPRSWTNAMMDLAEYHRTGKLEGFDIFDIDEFDMKFVLNKYVPAMAVDSFWSFLCAIRRIGDFDAAVQSAWTKGGKGMSIKPQDLIKVALPLAQLVICAHKDKLPTEKEFDSLVDWMVSTNDEQLASYVLDIFQNVFAANIPDSIPSIGMQNAKQYIVYLRKLYEGNKKVWSQVHEFDACLNAWGYTMDTFPDYSKSMEKLAKKYGAAFSAAMVDGKDGLG